MIRLSEREQLLGIVTASVVLFAVTFLLAEPRVEEWKKMRSEQRDLEKRITHSEDLMSRSETWMKRLDELKVFLPVYPEGEKVDAHFLSVMDKLAARNGIKILRRQAGEEKRYGDVYELPVECKEWEGTLDSLVHFLIDLRSQGAMLDIRHLFIRQQRGGELRGRFSLYCVYARE